MGKYRKRPVVVDAVEWDGSRESAEAIQAEFGDAVNFYGWGTTALECQTLEGLLSAAPGDWVIRGVEGEVYPCKPGIFAATYEEV